MLRNSARSGKMRAKDGKEDDLWHLPEANTPDNDPDTGRQGNTPACKKRIQEVRRGIVVIGRGST